MEARTRILRDTYQDSIVLMRAASQVLDEQEVEDAFAIVGTEANLQLLQDAGLFTAEAESATTSDVVLAVKGDLPPEALDDALDMMEKLLSQDRPIGTGEAEALAIAPATLEAALRRLPDANMVVISTAGEYAVREAWKSLVNGRHVHLFSDNVSVEDEIALKQYAVEKELLMMGPDCGTALINGIPLGFTNVVASGPIGIVSAAGTGLQEVMSLVDRFGSGVSQGIGTGGRDLKDEVGGLMMSLGMEALDQDPDTEVIVLISKPPGPKTTERILAQLQKMTKPVVVNFIGGELNLEGSGDVVAVDTLESAARQAVELAGIPQEDIVAEDESAAIESQVDALQSRSQPSKRKYLRGLFSGGTLASEAVWLSQQMLDPVFSNFSIGEPLDDATKMTGHAIVDYGEDQFTRGRPHPMLDPHLRNEYLQQTLEDPEVAAILLDVVLGYGSHPTPSDGIVERLSEMPEEQRPVVIASVCGTEKDPQVYSRQKEQLEEAGVYVATSNAAAVRIARGVVAQVVSQRGDEE